MTPRTTERLSIDGPAGLLEVVLNLPAAMAGGAELAIPPAPVAAKVAAQFRREGRKAPQTQWAALLRVLERTDRSYRD